MSTVAIDTVKQETSALTEAVTALVVKDTESYQTAGAWLVKVKGHRRRIKEFFAPILKTARETLDTARAQMTTLDDPAEAAEALLKRKMDEYNQAVRDQAEAERRRVAEEQRRLQAEADERARKDTARRQAEAGRLAAEATATRQQEAELAAALDAELNGGPAQPVEPVIPVAAVAVRPTFATPVFVPPAVVAAPPKAPGVSFREDWDFEVVDLALVSREYLIVDEVKLRRIVRAMKSTTSIPGIRAFSKRIVSSKAS